MKKKQYPIRKYLCTVVLYSMLLLASWAHAEYKVLFIGNSFTIGGGGAKTVPHIFDALAVAAGQEDPTTVMRAVGGKDFQYHYENSIDGYIDAQAWTHVVLQNYSTEPTHIGSVADHMLYGGYLYDAIIENNAATNVHLYLTWARAEANSLIGSSFVSTDEMLDELRTNYYELANTLTAEHPGNTPVIVNPIGDAWNNAGGNLSADDLKFIDLFGSDNYHGNALGYYLSACVHYASIYRANPVGLHDTPEINALGLGLSSADAAFVEQIAWETVLATGLVDSSVLIDFGSMANQTSSDSLSGDWWNNVTETDGTTSNASISDLINQVGETTTVDLIILSPFDSVELTGTVASTVYPATATADALYANTQLDPGQSEVEPSFKLSGLDPDVAYRLSFYAAISGDVSNGQTRYTGTGDRVVSADLNPQDNVDSLVVMDALYPDANNEITVSLTAGPENQSTNHPVYLGVLGVEALRDAALSLTDQPVSQSVEVNASVSFSVSVDSDRAVTAQWYQDGSPIDGATDLTYRIDQANMSQNGAAFSVIVTNGVFSVESSSATLMLSADLTSPQVDGVLRAGPETLMLTFNEVIDDGAALLVQNYKIVNRGHLLNPSAVERSVDGLTITLTFDETIEGNVVLQLAESITDLAGNSISLEERIQSSASRTDTPIYIDFGASSTVSDSVDTWNQVSLTSTIRGAVGNGTGTAHVFFSDLLDANNQSTAIGLSMSDTLNSTNTVGTSSGPYPSGATSDSLYGSDGEWGGFVDNAQAVFHFFNLDVGSAYDFTFYASRTGVSDNRETRYQLDGLNTGMADLNASNNTSNKVEILEIQPDADGVITLTFSKGPSNKNSDGFYYLNAMEIALSADSEPHVYPPVPLGDLMVVDWVGNGTLLWTDDLTQAWQAVSPEPTAPFLDEPDVERARFYQLTY
jgi:hypothetical protein